MSVIVRNHIPCASGPSISSPCLLVNAKHSINANKIPPPFTRSQCGELIRLFYGLAAAIGNLQAIFEISVVVEKTPERLPLVVLRVKLSHVLVK